jgi:flagellar biosynthesis protein FliP
MTFQIGAELFSALLILAGVVPYIRSILKREVRPNLVSWAGWTLLTTIAAAAQISKGASLSVLIVLMSTLGTGAVAVLAIKLGYTKFSRLDIVCFLLAGLAMILWWVTNEPLVAIGLALTADFIVAVPTIVKTYKDPASETAFPWIIFAVGAGIGTATSSSYALHNLLFPLYLFFINALIGGLALRGKIKKDKQVV